MRYFCEISFKGTNYHGWQKQPNANTVQETIEDKFSQILGSGIEATGCGRTDTGVHASQYYFHFDWEKAFPNNFLTRLNSLLPPDIAVRRIIPVQADAHARYDAVSRSYSYFIVFEKDTLNADTRSFFKFRDRLDFHKVQEAASLLLQFEYFFPFCKTHSDVLNYKCILQESQWNFEKKDQSIEYRISANRFLRGMVRLIVGMCLNAGLGRVALEQVYHALQHQKPLVRSWSVPPEGLILTSVRYPTL